MGNLRGGAGDGAIKEQQRLPQGIQCENRQQSTRGGIDASATFAVHLVNVCNHLSLAVATKRPTDCLRSLGQCYCRKAFTVWLFRGSPHRTIGYRETADAQLSWFQGQAYCCCLRSCWCTKLCLWYFLTTRNLFCPALRHFHLPRSWVRFLPLCLILLRISEFQKRLGQKTKF